MQKMRCVTVCHCAWQARRLPQAWLRAVPKHRQRVPYLVLIFNNRLSAKARLSCSFVSSVLLQGRAIDPLERVLYHTSVGEPSSVYDTAGTSVMARLAMQRLAGLYGF